MHQTINGIHNVSYKNQKEKTSTAIWLTNDILDKSVISLTFAIHVYGEFQTYNENKRGHPAGFRLYSYTESESVRAF